MTTQTPDAAKVTLDLTQRQYKVGVYRYLLSPEFLSAMSAYFKPPICDSRNARLTSGGRVSSIASISCRVSSTTKRSSGEGTSGAGKCARASR